MNSNLQTTGNGDRNNTDIASLNNELSNNNAVSAAQRDLVKKLTEVDEGSKGTWGTIFMRGGDKRLLHELDSARTESAKIILGSRNESLRVVGESLIRYTRAMASCHISVLETTNALSIDSHFLSSKTELHERLEKAEADFMEHIARKEQRIVEAPALLKPTIQETAMVEIQQYLTDTKNIITDFSKIRENRIK